MIVLLPASYDRDLSGDEFDYADFSYVHPSVSVTEASPYNFPTTFLLL